jgi:hypothetical protein
MGHLFADYALAAGRPIYTLILRNGFFRCTIVINSFLERVPKTHTSQNARCVGHPQPVLSRRVPHSFASFANEWVIEPSPIPKVFDRTTLGLQRPILKVYPHRPLFSVKI